MCMCMCMCVRFGVVLFVCVCKCVCRAKSRPEDKQELNLEETARIQEHDRIHSRRHAFKRAFYIGFFLQKEPYKCTRWTSWRLARSERSRSRHVWAASCQTGLQGFNCHTGDRCIEMWVISRTSLPPHVPSVARLSMPECAPRESISRHQLRYTGLDQPTSV